MSAMAALRFVGEAELAKLSQPGATTVVAFMATWNRRCQAFAPGYADLAARWAGKVTVVCVDVDESPALCTRFAVCSVPTVLVLQAGVVVHTMVGLSLEDTEAHLVGG